MHYTYDIYFREISLLSFMQNANKFEDLVRASDSKF